MRKDPAKSVFEELISLADIRVGGSRPWDMQIHHPNFYKKVLSEGSLGLGESYMAGWWDCGALDECFRRILGARLEKEIKKSVRMQWTLLKASILNRQRVSKAGVIGERHYDIGNDLFSIMLDEGMNYSCGYWYRADTLHDAQRAKLALTCRKLDLRPGMKVLDIGCGWGGFAKYAAENYGAEVYGITVSREQTDFAKEFCKGLNVCIEYQDYRDLDGTFDRIVSIGMFEHVGSRNYRTFMNAVHRCLESDGLFLLHTIGGNTSVKSTDQWIEKHIFPNSMLPSAKQITSAAEGLFVLEDWHSFGQYYDNTLMAWYRNFTKHWHEISDRYDDTFYRMWTYYLLSCAGSFRARDNQLWQIVLSKKGLQGGYSDRGNVFV